MEFCMKFAIFFLIYLATTVQSTSARPRQEIAPRIGHFPGIERGTPTTEATNGFYLRPHIQAIDRSDINSPKKYARFFSKIKDFFGKKAEEKPVTMRPPRKYTTPKPVLVINRNEVQRSIDETIERISEEPYVATIKIVGLMVGGLFVIIGIIVVYWYCFLRRKKPEDSGSDDMSPSWGSSENGNTEYSDDEQNDWDQEYLTQNCLGQSNAYQNGSYQNGWYQNGLYQSDSYQNGSYQDGSYQDGSYQNGSYQNASYQNGSYQNGTYQNGTYQDGSYWIDMGQNGLDQSGLGHSNWDQSGSGQNA
ncbi:uncharacterized protein [Aquarana catesbeiana]|uniref:uncharacterized protein n=1 Tax=Aquarana catesbeiana TaxID=8400 RepID=UPI003CC9A4D2